MLNFYLNENLQKIKANILSACSRANRNPDEIILLGVTKTIEPQIINEAINLGIFNIGESRVQEFNSKYPILDKKANLHFIGKLQTNKVKYIVDKVSLIHSVDSLNLANEINKRARMINKKVNILLQINISKEPTKNGIFVEEVDEFIKQIPNFSNLNLQGLMTIAPFVENPQENREYFKNMKKIFVDIKSKNKDNINMKYISMGMSNDYEVAIEEGANIIRIGNALFKSTK